MSDLYSGPGGEKRRKRDLITMRAIDRLYREHTDRPGLFDGVAIEKLRAKERNRLQYERYLEVMGRLPLHADEDRIALGQKPMRKR